MNGHYRNSLRYSTSYDVNNFKLEPKQRDSLLPWEDFVNMRHFNENFSSKTTNNIYNSQF